MRRLEDPFRAGEVPGAVVYASQESREKAADFSGGGLCSAHIEMPVLGTCVRDFDNERVIREEKRSGWWFRWNRRDLHPVRVSPRAFRWHAREGDERPYTRRTFGRKGVD